MLATLMVAAFVLAPQDPPPEASIVAVDVEWKGWFGKVAGREHPFVLRARGFFGLVGLSTPSKEEVDGTTRFVHSWLQAHPKARVRPVYEFDGLELSWALVQDGASFLNVELIRAGWGSATQMLGDRAQMRSLDGREHAALVAAGRDAELAALEAKAGTWGEPGAEGRRQFRLGEHRFEQSAFEPALTHYDAARAADFLDPLVDLRRAECLRRLGKQDEAEFAAERALLAEPAGFGYDIALEQLLEARARTKSVDEAVAWGRALVARSPFFWGGEARGR